MRARGSGYHAARKIPDGMLIVSRPRTAGVVFSLCACALAVTSAFAHEPEDAVVVTGRYNNEVGTWDSASQGAVTKEGIEKRPLLRTGEVLESVPGMIVTQHSGDGKANQYFLRGYNLDHGTDFATWVDGMPVNMPSHAHGQGYMDLNFLIPELFQKVSFNKGPYFAEDGDFASVGSARIAYLNTLPQSLATLTGGTFGYRRALLAGSPDAGPGHLLYAFELEHNDGPWTNPSNFRKGNGWFALFAPAKTPKDVIDRYARATIEVIRAPDMKQRLEQMGLEPTGLGPGELGAILKADYDKWGPVIRASGFKPNL